jgi:hypothetical protein
LGKVTITLFLFCTQEIIAMEWWSTMEMVTGLVGVDMVGGMVGVDMVTGMVGVDMVGGMVGMDMVGGMVGMDMVAGAEVVEEDGVIVAVEEVMVVDICNNSQVVIMTMVVEHLLAKAVVRFLIMLL